MSGSWSFSKPLVVSEQSVDNLLDPTGTWNHNNVGSPTPTLSWPNTTSPYPGYEWGFYLQTQSPTNQVAYVYKTLDLKGPGTYTISGSRKISDGSYGNRMYIQVYDNTNSTYLVNKNPNNTVGEWYDFAYRFYVSGDVEIEVRLGAIYNNDGWFAPNLCLNKGAIAARRVHKSILGIKGDSAILDDGKVGIGTRNPSSKLHVNGNVYVSSNFEVGTANLFVDTQTRNVGIGTTAPQAKLDTRGDAVFDTGKDDTTLTGLLNYSSTHSAIDAGVAQASSTGSITASTDINPPPGVAGDVIAKYVNSHTTEIFTRQFSASSLSITTGDVIYFGLWVYATLDVSIGLFKFGETTQNNVFTATGNSRWTWYEKTITSSGTTSNPEFRIDNDSPGKTYYFTGYTIRKIPRRPQVYLLHPYTHQLLGVVLY